MHHSSSEAYARSTTWPCDPQPRISGCRTTPPAGSTCGIGTTGSVRSTVFLAFIDLEVLGGRMRSAKVTANALRAVFPPHRPACLAGALGVHPAGDQVQRLDGGLLGGKVSADADGATVARVQGLDRIGGEQDPSISTSYARKGMNSCHAARHSLGMSRSSLTSLPSRPSQVSPSGQNHRSADSPERPAEAAAIVVGPLFRAAHPGLHDRGVAVRLVCAKRVPSMGSVVEIGGCGVLVVGDGSEPVDDVVLVVAFVDGEVGHEAVGRRRRASVLRRLRRGRGRRVG